MAKTTEEYIAFVIKEHDLVRADDLRKLVEECVDATSGHVTDWDEGVLWTTKKIKELLDGGE